VGQHGDPLERDQDYLSKREHIKARLLLLAAMLLLVCSSPACEEPAGARVETLAVDVSGIDAASATLQGRLNDVGDSNGLYVGFNYGTDADVTEGVGVERRWNSMLGLLSGYRLCCTYEYPSAEPQVTIISHNPRPQTNTLKNDPTRQRLRLLSHRA
jgi:hypothetical protein